MTTINEFADSYAREAWEEMHRRRWRVTPRLWDTVLYVDREGPLSTRDVAEHFGVSYKAAWMRLDRLRGAWVSYRDGLWSTMDSRRADLDAAAPGEDITFGRLLAMMPRDD